MRVGGVHSGTVREIMLPHRPGEKVTVVMDLAQVDARNHQARLGGVNRDRRTVGQPVHGDFIWILRGGRRARRRHHLQPAATRDDRPDQEDKRYSRQQPASHPERHAGDREFKLDQRQDRWRSGNRRSIGQRQAAYNNLEQTSSAMRDTMAQAQAGVTDFQDNMEALKHNFFLRGYFKNRGYENSSELAKNEIERLPQGHTS